jgi:hypothetical protein
MPIPSEYFFSFCLGNFPFACILLAIPGILNPSFSPIKTSSMYRYLMLLLFAGFLSSCNHSGGEAEFAQSDKMMSMEMPRTAEAPLPPGEQDAAIEPKIILTASMRCRVKDLERSTQSVRQTVEGMKGSVTQMNWVHSQSSIENMLTIRIPSDKLDTLLERISREATYVHYRNLHSEDVTAEYVDIETRLLAPKKRSGTAISTSCAIKPAP